MTMSDTGADHEWGALATLDAAEREARMQARYIALAQLADEDRRRQLLAMVQAEYALPDEQLRPFTVSRLRVWLRLEPPLAEQIAHAYDAVMTEMPGPVAMRRVGIVQTLAAEFPPEEEERLRALVPAVFAGQPHRIVGAATTSPATTAAAPAPAPAPRPWWAFWRR